MNSLFGISMDVIMVVLVAIFAVGVAAVGDHRHHQPHHVQDGPAQPPAPRAADRPRRASA